MTLGEKEKRVFHHNGLDYVLEWVAERHIHPHLKDLFGKTLLNYYNLVDSNQYPEFLFNQKDSLRCSSFRIKHLHTNAQKKISLDLIRSGHILTLDADGTPHNPLIDGVLSEGIKKLPKMAKIWFDIYSSTMDKNPGHDPILRKILDLNENALAIEVPIWTTTYQAVMTKTIKMTPYSCMCDDIFTGHIDLLLYNEKDQSVIVADYKPENEFLKSLPQVSIYGLVVKRMLRYSKVKCISFSREKAWIYDPEIIRTVIPEYLQRFGDPNLEWRDLVFSL